MSTKKITPILVDLRKDYNYDTLKRFYDELMRPNFPQEDELEPLENWVEMFQEGLDDDFEFEDEFDKILLSEEEMNGQTNNVNNHSNGNGGSNSIVQHQSQQLSCDVDFHVVLAICPDEHTQPGKSNIMGGVVFEYYPSINCGCVTYLLVSSEYRGQGLAGILLREATAQLMENGRMRGHLGGCNAIFLETNSAERVRPEDDVMDPAQRHTIFHKLGIRMIDFDYVQPPLSKESGKCRDLLLTVLLTPNIPRVRVGRDEKFYLPSSLLVNFLKVFWDSCCSRLGYSDWHLDIDYMRMMDQMARIERIPLLDLPWERPWTLIDVQLERVDGESLATKFYTDFLVSSMSPDLIPPLPNWLASLKERDTHLLLALRYTDDDKERHPLICGGLVLEYHWQVNCGLLTYGVVGNKRERVTKALIQRAIEILDHDAIERGSLAGCNAVFLETKLFNPSSTSTTSAVLDNCCSGDQTNSQLDGMVTELADCPILLEKLGWKRVDCPYVPPPITYDGKSRGPRSLAILQTDRVPVGGLPNKLLESFTRNHWIREGDRTGAMNWTMDNQDYHKMMDVMRRRERIPLRSLTLPTRPFILVDLANDYHFDLLTTFINSISVDQDIESIQQFSLLLNKKKQSNPNVYIKNQVEQDVDTHLVLALNYFDGSKPTIIGGVVCSYYLKSNCGVINHLFVKKSNSSLSININNQHNQHHYLHHQMINTINSSSSNSNSGSNNEDDQDQPQKHICLYHGWDVGRELIQEAVDILNSNACSRTHISGPNAIFLETPNNHQHQLNHLNNNQNNNKGLKIPHILSPDHSSINQQQQQLPNVNINNSPQIKFKQIPYGYALQQMGWLIVDIDYYQPPKGRGQPFGTTSSILSVLYTPQLPKLSQKDLQSNSNNTNNNNPSSNGTTTNQFYKSTLSIPQQTNNTTIHQDELSQIYIPKDVLRSFLSQHWTSCFMKKRLNNSVNTDINQNNNNINNTQNQGQNNYNHHNGNGTPNNIQNQTNGCPYGYSQNSNTTTSALNSHQNTSTPPGLTMDEIYLKMVEQIKKRDKIHLLDLKDSKL